MLQATGSHAGKTVLVAGLCRLLARRGLPVRPFKSQNMSRPTGSIGRSSTWTAGPRDPPPPSLGVS